MTTRRSFTLPDDFRQEVENWRAGKNPIPTVQDAVLELARIGLSVENRKKKRN